ncbi:hypothetical protein BJ742DRAFT_674874 [Cladochytrium replicatum]|nr:hypothetical protein BJ742DRAFT_674874 [Cladochytrium replicatum]
MNIGGGSHNIEGRNKPTSNTGLVYDIRMLSHRNIQDPPDRPDLAHPERPARISAAFGYLFEKGIGQECVRIEIPATGATDDILKLAHTEEHVNFLKQYEDCDDSELLEKASDLHQDIFFSHDSILAARVSCGGVLELCKAVWKGDVQNGVALVRPPGHHAEHDKAYGFCFFNNVAVAARYLQKFHQVKRILIVDWDVHHGNGIQKEFYNDPNVLYISLHRYKDFFPNDPVAYMDHVGGAEAEGRNVNIPWPCGGLRDADYLHAFHRIVMPVATEFQPDFVIVASGFDAAEGDPLGGCHISPGGYAHMAYMLKSLAKGKLVLALEGGYSIHAVKTSIYEVTRILLGHPPPLLPYRASHEDSENMVPQPVAIKTINQVIEYHSNYWKCLSTPYFHKPMSGMFAEQLSTRNTQNDGIFSEGCRANYLHFRCV